MTHTLAMWAHIPKASLGILPTCTVQAKGKTISRLLREVGVVVSRATHPTPCYFATLPPERLLATTCSGRDLGVPSTLLPRTLPGSGRTRWGVTQGLMFTSRRGLLPPYKA